MSLPARTGPLRRAQIGLADERADPLGERLRAWQWPDGGWNGDRLPQARVSRFTETLVGIA